MPDKNEKTFGRENLPQDKEDILGMQKGEDIANTLKNPNVNIGDIIYIQADYMISYQSIINDIFSKSGPDGFQVSVVYINKVNQAMTARAKFSETGWHFIEGQIHQNAGERLSEFVQNLRNK